MIPLEKLSPAAMNCLSRARQEAKRTGKRLIGTEHLLIALTAEGDGKLHSTLQEYGITEEKVVDAADRIAGTQPAHTDEDLSLTPRTERILQGALTEATAKSTPLILPEHMLLAMLKTDAGVASRIIEALKVDSRLLAASVANI